MAAETRGRPTVRLPVREVAAGDPEVLFALALEQLEAQDREVALDYVARCAERSGPAGMVSPLLWLADLRLVADDEPVDDASRRRLRWRVAQVRETLEDSGSRAATRCERASG